MKRCLLIRVMAPCMAMGEAAGRAAKMAVREGVSPAEINVAQLQQELLDNGAYLRTGEAYAPAESDTAILSVHN